MKATALFFSVIPSIVAAHQFAVHGEDHLFEEHRFELAQNDPRELREFDDHERRLATRTMEWPECKGMHVWEAKAYIEDYFLQYKGGHIFKNMALVVRQPRASDVFRETYYFTGVRSNMEVTGHSSCDRFDGDTVHLNRDNDSLGWLYANGTTYVVPALDCSGKTNAECCDIIWEHGEWMGLDKDGRHLTCYVYQEPSYPFFDATDRNLLKYPDYYNNEDGACVLKKYRFAALQRQYKKVADAIVEEVIEMIDNLFQPVALTGTCEDRNGNVQNEGIVDLKRLKGFGPSEALKQECFDMCVKYEIDTGVALTGCEAIWGGHSARGCYGHTKEVFRGSGKTDRRNVCWIDPIRPVTIKKIKCTDLKFVLDNSYNFARMTYLNGLLGKVQFEYYSEYCSNGEEMVPLYGRLKNMLMNIKGRATFTGEVQNVNFVYIVGGLDGIVASIPRVASNNPALNPIFWNSPA
jgi:hypothetical protein